MKFGLTIILLLISGSNLLMAASRYWVATLASNWNNTANWSATTGGTGGVSIPSASDIVFFDNGGVGNCSIDVAISITSISVSSGYTGIISQGSNVISISSTATFSAGTFTGGSANITVSGIFTLSGTAFTSTTATLEFKDNTAFTSGTFSANAGTVKYNISGVHTITGTSPSFYNLIVTSYAVGLSTLDVLSTGIIIVSNTLSSTGSNPLFINTGSIDARGDITIGNTSPNCGGTGLITINGTGTQNLSGAPGSDQGKLPKVTINKSSGTLNLFNVITFGNDFTYTAGAINTGTSTVAFGVGISTITGTVSLNNISFTPNPSGLTVSILSTITATGNLTYEGTGAINLSSGVIDVKGNFLLTNTKTGSGGGSGSITLTGTSNQSIDGSAILVDQCRLPLITVNKSSGTLSLLGNITLTSGIINTAGTISAGTSLIYIVNNSTLTGNFSLYNLTVNAPVTIVITVSSGNTITVLNDFTISGTSPVTINTGTIAVNGNIVYSNTNTSGGGTGTVLINGTSSQSITSTGVINQGRFPNVTISKSSGTLTFPSIISIVGNWTYTSGTLDVLTNNSTVAFEYTATITGSHTLNHVIFNSLGNYTYTIAAGTVLSVSGNMTIAGTGNAIFNTGNINLNGDLTLTNTATGGGGSTIINIVGTSSQAIDGSTVIVNQSRLPLININKASGTLSLLGNISFSADITYTTGIINAGVSTGYIVNNVTVTGSFSIYNLTIQAAGNTTVTIASGTTITVTNTLDFENGANYIAINTGIISVLGNIVNNNTSTAGGGTGTILISGTADQSITSTGVINQGKFPAVTLNKSSGTLTFPSLITVVGNWTYTTGLMDVSTNNSTVVFANTLTLTGSHSLKNINFYGSGYTFTFASGTVVTVNGSMTISGTGNVTLTAGNIDLYGDLNLTNTATTGGGTTVISFLASTNQSITSSLAIYQCKLPAITINKPSGTLIFPAIITVRSNWIYTAGTLDVTTNNSTIVFNATLAIQGVAHQLNNVTYDASSTSTFTINTDILTVAGTLTLAGASGCTINASTAATNAIIAKGDVIVTNNATNGGGNGIILINGVANQNLTGSGTIGNGRLPYITINKPSGTLTMLSVISAVGAWIYTAGIVDAGTSTVGLGVNALNVDAQGMNFYNFNVFASSVRTLASNLNVDGNLTITAGTLAASTRTINLKGNWTNVATANFTEATSTLNLVGTALQTITCPAGENFYNLTVNNSSTGIKLFNNVTIANTLNMTVGNIDLNANTLTLGISVTNNGTLARTLGTIINTGSFVRWFKTLTVASGSINGLFPVGTASDYRPFYVSAPTVAPTTGGTISMSYVDASPNTNVAITDGASTISIIKNLKWTLLTANGLAGGTYNIQVQGTGYGGIGTSDDLRLSLLSSVVGTAGTNAGTSVNPQVNRTSLSLANLSNTFYLGSVDATNSPLPIKLISFSATTHQHVVNLEWETATEIQNDYFTLLRSKDGKKWESLKNIKGKGNSIVIEHYSIVDSIPYNGLSYYKLKNTDFDGSVSFSNILSVHLASATSNLLVYPNPATLNINIVSSDSKKFKIRLLNTYGEPVFESISEIDSDYVLNIADFTGGMYLIQMIYDNFIEVKSIFISR